MHYNHVIEVVKQPACPACCVVDVKFPNYVHEKKSQFWLAESSAVLKKYSAKKGNTVQLL